MPAMRDFRNEFATHVVAHALPGRPVVLEDAGEELAQLLALLRVERRGDDVLGAVDLGVDLV
jgi:hypothetical protein